jgi:cytochrome c biogenesis protein CcdA
VIDAPLALAFTAGMVATVNPCGFAMLPAYLSFFLGVDAKATDGEDARAGIGRALAVAAAVSAGFVLVFGIAGLIISNLSRSLYDWAPWVTVGIGIALVSLGIALLFGFELNVRLPKLERGGRSRGLGSMFVFGVSYAVASLGCTLPIFLSAVSGTFRTANLASGLAVFAAYALGMALVLMALTIALALARHSLVRWLRSALPYVNRIAGALLVIAGAYVTYYAIYEIRLRPGDTGDGGPVDTVTGISSDISTWVQNTGGTRIGLALGAVVAVGVALTFRRRRLSRG